jgi:hypothetical protein
MKGRKDRSMAPIAALTLEDVVPPDHFDRHPDRVVDLTFVRELVRGRYAASTGHRPLIRSFSFGCGWACSSRAFAPSASSRARLLTG